MVLRHACRGQLRLHFGVGLGAVALGAAMLLFAVISLAVRPGPADATDLANVGRLEAKVARSESELKVARAGVAEAEIELAAKKAETAQRAARLDALEKQVRQLELERNQRVAETEKQVQAAGEQVGKEVDAANQALRDQARSQADQENVQRFLKDFEKLMVTVVNSELQCSSGFLLNLNQRNYVVTHRVAAPANAEVLLKMRVTLEGEQRPRTAVLRGTVAYKDAATGLAFLGLDTANVRVGFTLSGFTLNALENPANGERVYALGTQLLGNDLLEFTSVDGNVSAAECEVEGITYMQVAMPCNPGSTGSPVFNVRGKLVGVLVGPAPGLEKTSFAIAADRLKAAVERWQKGTPSATDAPAKPGVPAKADARTWAQRHPAPYEERDAFPLEDPHALVFGGANNTVVVWTVPTGKLACVQARDRQVVWQKPGQRDLSARVVCGDLKSMTLAAPNHPQCQEIDLVSGARKRFFTLPAAFDAYYDLGSCWLLCWNMEDRAALYNPQAKSGQVPAVPFRVLGLNGKMVLCTREDKAYYVDADKLRAKYEPLSATLQRLDQLTAEGRSPQDSPEMQQLVKRRDEQLEDVRHFMQPGAAIGAAQAAPGAKFHAAHLPGTNRVFIDCELFEFSATECTRIGALPKLDHSAKGEDWYLDGERQRPSHRAARVVVSPDGRYALTHTHLYDAQTLKPLAELPVPFFPSGFTGDSKTIFMFDVPKNRIAFLPVAEAIVHFGVRP
ncbi:MAG: trypsin-like peptidase domain-containing protein [Planctomycetota bacterium]|nr:trypsin-like peptidase domain-containing protein [Planctomycetota bacterium]